MAMTELNNQLGAIDLTRPFAEQENIQAFLGNPTVQEGTTVSNELLYRFLKLSEKFLSEESEALETALLTPTLAAVKLGYERRVALELDNNEYRIESHFVLNKFWKYEYDQQIRDQNLARLFYDSSEDPIDQETVSQPLPDLIALNGGIADELYRIYPQLQSCIEVHVYLFVKLPSPTNFVWRRNLSTDFVWREDFAIPLGQERDLAAATECNCGGDRTKKYNIITKDCRNSCP
jgi:hypothetical protein